MNTDGTGFTALYVSEWWPRGGLLEQGGWLYGVTSSAPVEVGGNGMIFRLATDGSSFTPLHYFDPATEGGWPADGLTRDSAGVLYGSTSYAGPSGYGTVFRMSPDGSGFAVVRAFGLTALGYWAQGLVERSDGFLYGVTMRAGTEDVGTIFKVAKDGSVFGRLHAFERVSGGFPVYGGLTEATDRALIGMGTYWGKGLAGVIFRLDLNQTATEAVVPMVDCVIDNGNGRFTAYFGYLNRNAEDVTIPIGWSNRLLPASAGRPQTEHFAPGRSPLYPASAFAASTSSPTLSWTLKGPDGQTRIAAATVNSRQCAGPPRTTPASETTALVGSPPRTRPP